MSIEIASIKPDAVTPAHSNDDLRDYTTDKLRQVVREALQQTAVALARAAAAIRHLEERNESLEDLDVGILPYLRKIAYGQAVPEIIVRYADRPELLRRLLGLPMPDQRMLADGGRVRLVVRNADGEFSHLMADPAEMTKDQYLLAFSTNGVRPESEQRLRLEAAKPRTGSTGLRKTRTITVNNKGELCIPKGQYKPAEILEALAELASPSQTTDERGTIQVATYVNDAEALAIKMAAAERATSVSALVRRSLLATGLLTPRAD